MPHIGGANHSQLKKPMYQAIFQEFGLAKNEAIIYEILLIFGQNSVSFLAKQSKIHRRNIYDSLERLIEKGMVFEVISSKENLYEGVNPEKLREHIAEKSQMLEKVMPDLSKLFSHHKTQEQVYIYKGAQGAKNYMQDIIRTGEDVYCIGAKGGWLDERVKNFFPIFERHLKNSSITCWHLFDHEVREDLPEITKYIGENFKFLPKEFSTNCSVDIFGDRVNLLSNLNTGGFGEDFSFTVIVNAQMAEAFRTWFKLLYGLVK
ncbi:hypothetical protein HN954_02925 [bacterium]|jgi:sugar-specific transcriptional regulator TrmB|nr:hypothetical protein [bacterium]MBT6831451.1 hypothetical protein [bacterium]MBT6996357.1 hypothetical protein [bacterium]MBT7772424.1 hypothetical protein [bacterium]